MLTCGVPKWSLISSKQNTCAHNLISNLLCFGPSSSPHSPSYLFISFSASQNRFSAYTFASPEARCTNFFHSCQMICSCQSTDSYYCQILHLFNWHKKISQHYSNIKLKFIYGFAEPLFVQLIHIKVFWISK